MHKKHVRLSYIGKYFFLLIGTVIAAAGLEFFLVPNNIIDGGVVGISIITSYLTKLPLGLFTFALNIPFLIFGYKQIGKTFVISSLVSITAFSLWVSVFHPIPGLTHDVLLAAVFGGIILGIGVGLIIRYGGSLDGTEMVAIVVNKRTVFSVGQTVMFFNIFILTSAGLVFGWDRAMYSLIAYFIAFKVIDITVEGLDETKAAFIITEKGQEIAEAISARLGRGVTLLEGRGGFTQNAKIVLYSVISRLEVSKLKGIVTDIDDSAFVTVSDVSDLIGGKYNKKNIH
ncbi:Uncharacterized membrane-anchored protein YitT, contains DUF161 and DUF2179 domains [Sporobacter termitidis DSM 10068]|uniref:Uncharacterized membrane-anchored protein YitT, contains DUF161 and DUF2179 domains n=1 Tax=Sporobacter termitidis DSM 10068 TaxID=1123282 RepID=A0A1M5Y2T0_9FIRM|nr:YitT family protein [Sporobacter termitidis]SHI06405.1 Uncharacterized membrane-anchored protein YitT, contains DUF161 and DUF2179 domains [Sporobacter termitidis DSM 10068]